MAVRVNHKNISRPLAGSAWAVYAALLMPIIAVVWLSFTTSSTMRLPSSDYDLRWYAVLPESGELWSGLRMSLVIAALAAIIATVLGLLAALATEASSLRWVTAIELFFTGPIIVPTIVISVAIYVTYFRLGTAIGIPLVPSNNILLAGHVLITLPWCFRVILLGFQSRPKGVEQASLNLGRKRIGTFFLVTAPLIKSSIFGGAIFAFIISFADLEISLFLAGDGSITLPVAMANRAYWSMDPSIAAMGSIQIGLCALLLALGSKFVKPSTLIG